MRNVTKQDLMDFSLSDLKEILKTGTREDIVAALEHWGLEIKGGKIIPRAETAGSWDDIYEYFDKRQHVLKISLNSCYGALLNEGCRFFDQRLGQSTTLNGRSINRHQASKINELITGEYAVYGESQVYCDTDSETGDTIHLTSRGEMTIEEIFNQCEDFWEDGVKEYGYDPELMVLTYDNERDEPYFGHTQYIYRHRVSKDLYTIEDQDGNQVTVTQDHSVMVERDGELIEVKPQDIQSLDVLISVTYTDAGEGQPGTKDFTQMISSEDDSEILCIYNRLSQKTHQRGSISLEKRPVKSVTLARRAENEYVYDIGMKNEKQPWFFGNKILLHNSVYFTAYPTLKPAIDAGQVEWNSDSAIALYDSFVPVINDSFPVFLRETFNVPEASSKGVIKCGREIVAESGIWMVKKRYACLMVDKDGRRYDVDGKPGKIKAMGLDLKRSDTPKVVQKFLSDILLDTLTGRGEDRVIESIREFKRRFSDMKPWQQGTPKAVNKLTQYKNRLEEHAVLKASGRAQGSLMVPGHVTASLAWNHLREIHRDRQSMKITDGMKIIVCKLKITPNNHISSIAYPVDESRLPEWFTSLPFDDDGMMSSVVDKKVENLLGVLRWDLSRANPEFEHMSSLFDFGAIKK